MGSEESKQTSTSGNSNTNDITIIEQIQGHSDIVKLLLGLIVCILLINLIHKLYVMKKRSIQKEAIRKSKANLEEI